jgi:hypothetical protein
VRRALNELRTAVRSRKSALGVATGLGPRQGVRANAERRIRLVETQFVKLCRGESESGQTRPVCLIDTAKAGLRSLGRCLHRLHSILNAAEAERIVFSLSPMAGEPPKPTVELSRPEPHRRIAMRYREPVARRFSTGMRGFLVSPLVLLRYRVVAGKEGLS